MWAVVVETLQLICRNPQTLVDIFLNYDCDLESKDIFEKMVLDLSATAKVVAVGVECAPRTSLTERAGHLCRATRGICGRLRCARQCQS